MTIPEIVAVSVLAFLAIGSLLEVLDYWLNDKISDAIKEWWNRR